MLEKHPDMWKTPQTRQQRLFKIRLVKGGNKLKTVLPTNGVDAGKFTAPRHVVDAQPLQDMCQQNIAQSHCLADAQPFIIESNSPWSVIQHLAAFKDQRLDACHAQKVADRHPCRPGSYHHNGNICWYAVFLFL